MKLDDLRNLDPNNIGSWPLAAKALVILVVCALVLGGGYWFHTQHQIADLETARATEQKKRAEFENKQKLAANLEPLKEQLEDMKNSFGAMLRQLPNKSEIEALLVDISQTGLASGLEFELFQPMQEQRRDFYAEKPIKIRVTGTYHEFGRFVSGVAALPRIVTQHDISIRPQGKTAEGNPILVMESTAKTYRYLDNE